MKLRYGHWLVIGSATIAFALISLLGSVRLAAGSNIRTTGNVSVVPQSPMVSLRSAAAGDVTLSPDVAAQVASGQWKLAAGQIDEGIGLVRADVTVNDSPLHQHQKAWLVVADFSTVSPGSRVQYSKLVIAIDGKTGQYLYAYPVDPNGAQLNAVSGVRERGGGRAAERYTIGQ